MKVGEKMYLKRKVDDFLEEFKPDILLFSIESYIYFNRINKYIIEKCKPSLVVGFLWDDNFTYKQSKLLDDIFLGRVNNLDNIKYDEKILLTSIEPAYVAKYYEYYSSLLDGTKTPDEVLRNSIFDYCNRYNVSNCLGSEYKGKDILTNQPTEVKRLIKCINNK